MIGTLVAAGSLLAIPGTALAARSYVAVGDSVGAGTGATAGGSYFDLYCSYLKSAGRVDQCVNESQDGMTTSSALSGGAITRTVNDIVGSTDTPVVTVILGGNDVLGSGCEPITATGCPFDQNMGTILGELETALAVHPGAHYIQWLEYYNPNHDNPFGSSAQDTSSAELLLGSDLAFSDCSSSNLALFGLDDEINCIARRYGATPVDAYTPFQANCAPPTVCFSDSLHPDDTGYALIFDALRDTPGTPVPVPSSEAPVDTAPPVVAGVGRPGHLLACSHGSWLSATPITYAVQWQRDGLPLSAETAWTYKVGSGDLNQAISCAVTASNASGSATATSTAVEVMPEALISSLAESRRAFIPGTPRHKHGITFSFRLNVAATVTAKIGRELPGRRVGARCLSGSPRRRDDRRCTRTQPITTLIVYARVGHNSTWFSGDRNGRRLAPGRYRASFSVLEAAPPPAQTLRFRILRR